MGQRNFYLGLPIRISIQSYRRITQGRTERFDEIGGRIIREKLNGSPVLGFVVMQDVQNANQWQVLWFLSRSTNILLQRNTSSER